MSDERLTTDDIASSRSRQDEAREPGSEAAERPAASAVDDLAVERDQPLMSPSDLDGFRRRWETVQAGFVDDPRTAVEEADQLVAEAMRRLADTFSSQRSELEEQWDRGGEADTEALRVTLQRYRSFFNRLLSA